MFEKKHFIESISSSYKTRGDYIYPGAAMQERKVFPEMNVKTLLMTMNRATRAGKQLEGPPAFPAKDRKAIRLAAENYPLSELYDTKNELTALGIGEALVTALEEKGSGTPLVPQSRMVILTPSELEELEELEELIKSSDLKDKNNDDIKGESVYALLAEKFEKEDADNVREKALPGTALSIIKIDHQKLTSATFFGGVMGVSTN